jgi:thiamine pyrophosphokinase
VRALIVADGSVPARSELDASWPGWSEGIGLVVAADGGALVAETLGFEPDLIVGDGDSLGAADIAAFRARGVEVAPARPDKDESDTELAVLAALERGADAITVLAGFGGRLDHTLANIWLLALPALAGRAAELLDGATRVTLISALDSRPVRRVLGAGRVGDLVSLLPLGGDVDGIVTEGLLYALHGEPLRIGPSRGLSNVRGAGDGEVAVTIGAGRLLVIEAPASLDR